VKHNHREKHHKNLNKNLFKQRNKAKLNLQKSSNNNTNRGNPHKSQSLKVVRKNDFVQIYNQINQHNKLYSKLVNIFHKDITIE